MRNPFILTIASLTLCGATTVALFSGGAFAQNSAHNPTMVLAQSTKMPQPNDQAVRRMRMRDPAAVAAHMKERCNDRYAQRVGHMAYLEARLELTPAEQPLFAHWREVKLEIAKRQADECSQRVGHHDQQKLGPVEHMARIEDKLKKRLANLDAERQPFAAFYNSLTPDQQAKFSSHHHRHHHHMKRREFIRRHHSGMEFGQTHQPH